MFGCLQTGLPPKRSESQSILDSESIVWGPDNKITRRPYLDTIPFPKYFVVRDPVQLPAHLADIIRQWFELSATAAD